jgi:hypothetical protein
VFLFFLQKNEANVFFLLLFLPALLSRSLGMAESPALCEGPEVVPFNAEAAIL